jgi:hypothetical protein
LATLGTLPNGEVALRIGRTIEAAPMKRAKARLPPVKGERQ